MTDTFTPKSSASAVLGQARTFFQNYLTPISILVAAAGIVLLVLGPIGKGLVGNNTRSSLNDGQTGQGTESNGISDVGTADSAASADVSLVGRKLTPYTIIPDRPRNRVVTYNIQAGDTIMGIALRYNLDRSSIYWANMDTLGTNVHMIDPGSDIYILPTDGVYHKSDGIRTLQWIADEYFVNVDDIINSDYNELAGYTASDVPDWGMRIVIPGGTGKTPDWNPIREEVTSTGVRVTRFMPGMPGSCAPMTGSGGSGAWVNPMGGGYTVTAPFYQFHSGIDLGSVIGVPVVAADTGKVIFAGWNNWGYGYLVVLDHGNGWTTYYGHLSSVGVSCGQMVSRGQFVGGVGSTGNSTGPHLHFEMRWYHTPDNPASWLGF